MNKKIFFNQDGVTVSKTRLIVHGQLYEIKNISSLGYKKLPPNYSFTVFCCLLGIVFIADEGELFAFGGCLVLMGIVNAFIVQPKHVIVLNMPNGSVDAVISSDKPHIDRVIQAVQASMGSGSTIETLDEAVNPEEIPVFASQVVE